MLLSRVARLHADWWQMVDDYCASGGLLWGDPFDEDNA